MRQTLTALLAAAILAVAGVSAWQLKSLHDQVTSLQRDLAGLHHELTGVRRQLETQRDAPNHLQRRTTSSSSAAAHRQRAARAPSSLSQSQRVVVKVEGLNYAFAPSTLVVKVGATVTWVNETMEPHTVTSFQTGLFYRSISPQKTATLVFHHAGVYRYYCGYHPYMRGVIIVRR